MNTEQRQMKRATELLVQSIGGIEKAAAILDKGKSTVGRWTNKNDDDSINLFALHELEQVAEEPLVTQMLARLAGGVFIALPQMPGSSEALPMQVMDLAKEFGELSDSIREGLSDGHFGATDAAKALTELHGVERCAAALRVAITAHAGSPIRSVA